MCLKLQELSQSCYFAAEEAEGGCKAVRAVLQGERAQYLLFHPHQGRNLAYVLGEVLELTAPNQPNLKI